MINFIQLRFPNRPDLKQNLCAFILERLVDDDAWNAIRVISNCVDGGGETDLVQDLPRRYFLEIKMPCFQYPRGGTAEMLLAPLICNILFISGRMRDPADYEISARLKSISP